MGKQANKQLLRAVLEPRTAGAIQQIADACAAGADPNGICPECSTSSGHVRGGSTLLTHAIHSWSSRVVAKLLECGADPNLVDDNGWTPWMASIFVDDSKRNRIQELLTQSGSKQHGEHIGQLARAITAGRVDQASTFIESDQDLQVLSTFRVDILAHQIRSNNAKMLEFLLEHKMTPQSDQLSRAVRAKYLPAVDSLLRYGLAPEQSDDNETLLMTAASSGDLAIVQRLVEAGADVNRYADNNIEWTASFYAQCAGNVEVAQWLKSRMSDEMLARQAQVMATRDPNFRALYEHATASEALSTDEICARLAQWDQEYDITVADASRDGVTIEFSSLPKNIDGFYQELLVFCPDICESKRAIKAQLTASSALQLWWD